MRKLTVLCGVLLVLSACSGADLPKGETIVPNTKHEARQEQIGSLSGEGGMTLLGGHSHEADQGGSPLGVNAYLWRATLDTLGFMPLASADPFGGVIITDWYEDPKVPGERFKVNAIILDKTLRADGVKVTAFKQHLDKGVWHDQPVESSVNRSLEDTILTRARQLRVNQLGK